MDTKQIIQTINDLIETPEHSKIRWYVEKQALDLIEKLETKQLIIADVSDTLIAWEQFKKANWYESEAIDVEKMLMDKFQAIYGR